MCLFRSLHISNSDMHAYIFSFISPKNDSFYIISILKTQNCLHRHIYFSILMTLHFYNLYNVHVFHSQIDSKNKDFLLCIYIYFLTLTWPWTACWPCVFTMPSLPVILAVTVVISLHIETACSIQTGVGVTGVNINLHIYYKL